MTSPARTSTALTVRHGRTHFGTDAEIQRPGMAIRELEQSLNQAPHLRQVTVPGLDTGIHAGMTAFSGLSALV